MPAFLVPVASVVLGCGILLAIGQPTMPSCGDSPSEPSDVALISLKECANQLLDVHQNCLSSKFEKLEKSINEAISGVQRENGRNLDVKLRNISFNCDKSGEKIRLIEQCLEAEEQQMNSSLSSWVEKMNGTIKSTGESSARILEQHDQNMRSAVRNLSAQLDERFQESDENHDQNLEVMHQNLSNRLTKLDEKLDALQISNDINTEQVIEHEQRLQIMQENISSAIDKLTETLNTILDQVNANFNFMKSQGYCGGNPTLCDCSTIKTNGFTASRNYRVHVINQNKPFYADAYCDMSSENSSWTVFQRRKDGSEDFFRGWNDYANGFGNPNGEFWLGNEFLHQLTSNRSYRLRIDFEDFEGNTTYAEYSTFKIGSSEDKYRLNIEGYSGDAGDSLAYHNNRPFTTKDSDNDDKATDNCAAQYHSAWWFGACYFSSLNGLYYKGFYRSTSDCLKCGIAWHHWRNVSYSLKTTEMKISAIV